jgi:aminoglycoside 6'-N-acetyltransferase
MPILPITTPRLRLRRLEEADAAALAAWRSDPENARYIPRASMSREDALQIVAEMRDRQPGEPGVWFQLVIETRDGVLVGDLGLRADATSRVFEVGYVLAREHQGQGYATEAVRGALGFLFGELGAHRVFGNLDARNTASARVLERVGMRREAHHLEDYDLRGEWTDTFIYAILRREWA